ncbi:hypothetical protein Gotur_003763 [Gossypium turneri]
MKRLTIGPMVTSEYNEWWNKRVNDNIPRLREENVRPIGEYLQVTKADQWEKRFQDARAREVTLEKSQRECQNEKEGLKARITELEKLLHQHRSRNFAVELKVSLRKIEELQGKIGELEDTLHNGEL